MLIASLLFALLQHLLGLGACVCVSLGVGVGQFQQAPSKGGGIDVVLEIPTRKVIHIII